LKPRLDGLGPVERGLAALFRFAGGILPRVTALAERARGFLGVAIFLLFFSTLGSG
jgi:hypothetical protein